MVLAVSIPAAAQAPPAAAKTSDRGEVDRPAHAGRPPDLQGLWSYATLTPLERPAEFAGKEFLSEAGSG